MICNNELETLLQTQQTTATRFAKAISTLRIAATIAQQGGAA